jgi:predicted esterase
MTVPVEDFLAKAVENLRKRTSIDPRYVFTLSWSSGGPAAYAASLSQDTPVMGSLVAMRVFKPNQLPELTQAKGKHYYILHSPGDKICPYRMAQAAQQQLSRHGAIVKFAEYAGGHGWRGDVYGNIRAGITWLEDHTKQAITEEDNP